MIISQVSCVQFVLGFGFWVGTSIFSSSVGAASQSRIGYGGKELKVEILEEKKKGRDDSCRVSGSSNNLCTVRVPYFCDHKKLVPDYSINILCTKYSLHTGSQNNEMP